MNDNDNDNDAEAQTHTERWVFGGSRVGSDGKRMHCWIDPGGDELYFKVRGSHAVGAIYEVEVSHTDAGRIVRHGDPRYTGDRADDAVHDGVSARHRAAEASLDLAARERRAKADDPVEAAIERLVELSRNVKPHQRTAFWAHVIARLTRPANLR